MKDTDKSFVSYEEEEKKQSIEMSPFTNNDLCICRYWSINRYMV